MNHTLAAVSPTKLCAIAHAPSRGEISPLDVAAFRARASAETAIDRDDAEALFAAERGALRTCPEWTSFFVETITDHVVWQARPTGVVSNEQAEWLFENVVAANSLNAFAALLNVLTEADRVPAWLAPATRSLAAAGLPDSERALAEAREWTDIAA